MLKNTLKIINRVMNEDLKLSYSLGQNGEITSYPFFVGEYQENEPMSEDGESDTALILTGFASGSWADLEEAKEKIKAEFDPIEGHVVYSDGSAAAIFYESAQIIPSGDPNLKRIQINLKIKEWSV